MHSFLLVSCVRYAKLGFNDVGTMKHCGDPNLVVHSNCSKPADLFTDDPCDKENAHRVHPTPNDSKKKKREQKRADMDHAHGGKRVSLRRK